MAKVCGPLKTDKTSKRATFWPLWDLRGQDQRWQCTTHWARETRLPGIAPRVLKPRFFSPSLRVVVSRLLAHSFLLKSRPNGPTGPLMSRYDEALRFFYEVTTLRHSRQAGPYCFSRLAGDHSEKCDGNWLPCQREGASFCRLSVKELLVLALGRVAVMNAKSLQQTQGERH